MTYFEVKDISRGRQDKFHELRSSVTPKIWFLTSQDKGFENLVNKISPEGSLSIPWLNWLSVSKISYFNVKNKND